MTFDQIMSIVVAAAPTIASIVGIITACVKAIKSNQDTSKEVIDKFEEVRQEVFNTKEYSDLKEQLKVVYAENAELKKYIKELLTKIDGVSREE